MTPAERAVIGAALIWRDAETFPTRLDLEQAVDVLRAERADVAAERTRPWSEVVTEDEIYSTKTKKWYRVVETNLSPDGATVDMRTEGMAKAKAMPADAQVLVRRSEMGQAVDVWIDVMSSGPSR